MIRSSPKSCSPSGIASWADKRQANQGATKVGETFPCDKSMARVCGVST